MGLIERRTLNTCMTQASYLFTCFIRVLTFLCFATSICLGQSQDRSDFYGEKLEIVNKPEIKRDLERDWTQYYPDPVDEDSRYELSILEELETRKQHLKKVFKITFKKDGDLPSVVINRIRYPIPDRFYEVPHTYELLEHIECWFFHHFDIKDWEYEKKKVDNVWEYEEWMRKLDFISDLKDKGVAVSLVYEYYEFYLQDNQEVQLDGLETTFESLGYIEIPPEYPPKPKPKPPVFGFNLWTVSKKSLPKK